MNDQSENIEKISVALSKSQSQITGAIRDSENPFYKSDYADLASVWEAIRKPMSDNGLAVIQTMEQDDNDTYLITKLIHSSGQWFSSRLRLLVGGRKDMQALGGAITYARRYSLSAIMGVSQVDDDGNSCSNHPDNNSRQPQNNITPPQKKTQLLPKDILRNLISKLTDEFKNKDAVDDICTQLHISCLGDIANKVDEDINDMIAHLESKK